VKHKDQKKDDKTKGDRGLVQPLQPRVFVAGNTWKYWPICKRVKARPEKKQKKENAHLELAGKEQGKATIARISLGRYKKCGQC